MSQTDQDNPFVNQPLRLLVVAPESGNWKKLEKDLSTGSPRKILPQVEIQTTSSAACALQIYSTYQPNCTLIDYELADMTGLDLLRRLRSLVVHRDSAMIMMISQADPHVSLQSIRFGAQECLMKEGLTAESLALTIRNAVERTRYREVKIKQQDEMDYFAGSAAHDLLSPLASLSLMIEVAQEMADAKLGNELDEYFTSMGDVVDRISALVHGLDTYANIGHDEIEYEEVDLQIVFDDVLEILKTEITSSDATIESEPLPTINGDYAGMLRVFQNLVENALKFCRDRAPQIQVRVRQSGDDWLIRVSDNGIGIEPEDQLDIFEPFRRPHADSDYSGHGLGLAICKKIIERHHGRIWVESRPHEGANFYISLPADLLMGQSPNHDADELVQPRTADGDKRPIPSIFSMHRNRPLLNQTFLVNSTEAV